MSFHPFKSYRWCDNYLPEGCSFLGELVIQNYRKICMYSMLSFYVAFLKIIIHVKMRKCFFENQFFQHRQVYLWFMGGPKKPPQPPSLYVNHTSVSMVDTYLFNSRSPLRFKDSLATRQTFCMDRIFSSLSPLLIFLRTYHHPTLPIYLYESPHRLTRNCPPKVVAS